MKNVDIEYCGDCPHRFYKNNDLFCGKTDRQTTEGDTRNQIPEWCPLPDSVDNNLEDFKEILKQKNKP